MFVASILMKFATGIALKGNLIWKEATICKTYTWQEVGKGGFGTVYKGKLICQDFGWIKTL